MSEFLECQLYLADFDQAVLKFGGAEYSGKPTLNSNWQKKTLEASVEEGQYGRLLFGEVFPSGSDLLTGYRIAVAMARYGNNRLRFRVCIDINAPEELHSLQWELLYDPKERICLSRASGLAFSRYTNVDLLSLESSVPTRPRLLVVVSTPTDLGAYHLDALDKAWSRKSLEESLLPVQDLFQVDFLEGNASPINITNKLLSKPYDVIHIYAHGIIATTDRVAKVALEGSDGTALFVPEDDFRETLVSAGVPKLIVLSCCHSGVRSRSNDPYSGIAMGLIRRGIPAVIAMRSSVGVKTADIFFRFFYENLARTGEIDSATNDARNQCYLSDPTGDWGIPSVFMRLTDGLLWKPGVSSVPAVSDDPGNDVWPPLIQQLKSKGVIPIIGPAVNNGLLPSSSEIARRWAQEHQWNRFYQTDGDQTDLARVAKFLTVRYAGTFPHSNLIEVYREDLLSRETQLQRQSLENLSFEQITSRVAGLQLPKDPLAPHAVLAEIPFEVYLTTNYDSFLTAALRLNGRSPNRVNMIWGGEANGEKAAYSRLSGTSAAPLVFHLYGSDKDPTSMVLTDDDYLDFTAAISRDQWRLPLNLRERLTKSMLLFIGYDIRDMGFRVLFKSVIAQLKQLRQPRIVVVQIDPTESSNHQHDEIRQLQDLIQRDTRHLNLLPYWASVKEFLTALRTKWNG